MYVKKSELDEAIYLADARLKEITELTLKIEDLELRAEDEYQRRVEAEEKQVENDKEICMLMAK